MFCSMNCKAGLSKTYLSALNTAVNIATCPKEKSTYLAKGRQFTRVMAWTGSFCCPACSVAIYEVASLPLPKVRMIYRDSWKVL